MSKATIAIFILFFIGNVKNGLSQTAEDSSPASPTHRFWDKPNIGLFAGVAAIRMLDYSSTRYFRRRGNNEALLTNEVVDDKPIFIAIELTGTAASIGISYLFHATGHHRLERWASIVHIGIGTFGFSRNYIISRNNPVIRR
jgi:hypothetical protein